MGGVRYRVCQVQQASNRGLQRGWWVWESKEGRGRDQWALCLQYGLYGLNGLHGLNGLDGLDGLFLGFGGLVERRGDFDGRTAG